MARNDDEWEDGPEDEETVGIVLGVRIVEDAGDFYLAEAEIAPYVDEPGELGVTLVFHPLAGLDPAGVDEEDEWPSWPVDVDEDVTTNSDESLTAQFAAIVRYLHGLGETKLRTYLRSAREEAGDDF